MLLGELLQKIFALYFHQEAPEPLPGARDTGLEKSDFPFPFGTQQVVIGTDIGGLDQIGVVKRRRGKIRDKGIDETVRFQVVFPKMTAPPLARVLDLRENQSVQKRREHIFVGKRLQGARPAMENVEVTNAGFELRHGPRSVLRPGSGKEFQL